MAATRRFRVTELITTNFWSKVLAMICAIALWFYLSEKIEKDEEYEFVVSAEKPGEQDDWIVVPTLPDWIILPEGGSDQLGVRFVGPTEAFRELRNVQGMIDERAFLLNEGVDEAKIKIQVNDIDFGTPAGIRAEARDEENATLTFSVSRRITKELTVEPTLATRSHPLSNYEIGTIVARPSAVRVSGPKSYLDDRETIELAPLAVKNSELTTQIKEGRLTDEAIALGVLLENEVEIEIPIEPAFVEKTVSITVMVQAPLGQLRLPEGKSLDEMLKLNPEEGVKTDVEGRFSVKLKGPSSAFTQAALDIIQGPGVFYIELTPNMIELINNKRFYGDYVKLHYTDLMPDDIRFPGDPPELKLEMEFEGTE